MRRIPGCRFPVLGWVLLAAVGAGGFGVAQVRVGGELGWQGIAVAGEVNPLAITVENGTGAVLSATLRAEQRLGSGWRGQVLQRLRVPVLLAPGGRTRLLFPWPVEAGSDPITVVLESGGAALAQATLPLRLEVEKPVAVAGALVGPSSGPVLVLSPADLPEEPLLLGPFSAVEVAPAAFVPAVARDALQAWATFGGGAVRGVPVPVATVGLRETDLRQALREHGQRSPPLGLVLGGTAIYLAVLGYALRPLSRRTRSSGIALLLPTFLAFSLFYSVWVEKPHGVITLQYSIIAHNVSRFSYDSLVVVSRRGGVVEIDGWWVERVVPGSQRTARVVSWVWTDRGARTSVEVDPGETLFLYRYGRGWVERGEAVEVGPEGWVGRVEPGFAPLLAAVGGHLREGDQLELDFTADRKGDAVWYVYRLRWMRDG